jgi:two-component system sensor histidine kinase KdpD
LAERAIEKPSAEELLRRIQADERRERRGRLKVFLGYSSRVGKSFRMFDEGRRRKERGEDVVVAAVQGEIKPDIAAILNRLEMVPTVTERHAGRTYEVIDINTLFRRRPQVCLIDGLAADNPPGSRHPRRWQDVEELLDHGISVITSLNLQHIREMQDDVERITAKRSPYSVPAAFLREADEIEVVDAPPEALVDRGAAQPGLPDPRRLSELRELALLLAADVVDHQLQDYLASHGVQTAFGAQERILVCLTPRSNAEAMLRSGSRNAKRFHGALLAAYVEQPGLGPEDRARLDRNLALARELGAEVHCLHAGDFVDTIVEFARRQRVTQIFAGHSMAKPRFWHIRNPIDRLIEAAADFDLRLFPHEERK